MQEDPSLLKKYLTNNNIYISNSLFNPNTSIFKELNLEKNNYTFIITDSNVKKIHLSSLVNVLNKIGYTKIINLVVKSGEKSKNIKVYNNLVAKISSYNINKNSTIIAFGGGVVGDIAGFCASTILRGIKFVNIPSTLLAMSDSAIGGKNGINTIHGKNSLGTFYKAYAIVICPELLKTLNLQELKSGLFEVIKIALIQNYDFYNYLESNYNKILANKKQETHYVILKSIALKLHIVEQDFLETKKLRYLLNLGHTYGHAIEEYFSFNKIKHGFAVAIGIICANFLSTNLGLLKKEDCIKLNKAIKSKLPAFKYNKLNTNKLYNLMLKDKKQTNNNINVVALHNIGQGTFLQNISEFEIKKSLQQGVNYIT